MNPIDALMGADLQAGSAALPRYSGNGYNRIGQAIGEALSGTSQTPTYQATLSRGGQLYKQLAEARIKTDEANARERAQSSIAALYPEGDPRGAAFSDAVAAGYGNLDQVTQSGINLTRDDVLRKAAADALAGADMDQINNLLTVYQGKPRERTHIASNTAFDPYAAPDQPLRMTDYGRGHLANDAVRAQAAVTAALRPRSSGSSASDPAKELEQQIKVAARDALYSARADGQDLYGVTLGDIEHALRTKGEWRNPNDTTKVVRFGDAAIDRGEDPGQLKPDGQPVSAPVSAPASRAPAAATPPRSAAQRIQDAKDALAAGADPAKVRARMLQVGLNPAAAGL